MVSTVDDFGILVELCRELCMKSVEVLECIDIRKEGDDWIYLALKGWLKDSQFNNLCKIVKKLGGIRLGAREFRIPVVLPDNKESDVEDGSASMLTEFF
jgi:hypothetical protein